MCSLLLGINLGQALSGASSGQFPVVAALNRDEPYARPTIPMHRWHDHPSVIAGIDQVKGGTWFGVTDEGRFAALTNRRAIHEPMTATTSRGLLVKDFLTSQTEPDDYIRQVNAQNRCQQFNLVVGNLKTGQFFYTNDRGEENPVEPMQSGIYGLTNGYLTSNWPKTERGKHLLNEAVQASAGVDQLHSGLHELLLDTHKPDDADLPKTGLSPEKERALSSLFVALPDYGTRDSTTLVMEQNGAITLDNRFLDNDQQWQHQTFALKI